MQGILDVSYPRKQSDDQIIALKLSRGIHALSRRMLNNIRTYEGYVRMTGTWVRKLFMSNVRTEYVLRRNK